MSKKSISPLFLILSLTGVLFVSALIWKSMQTDNSEKITVHEINPVKKPSKIKKTQAVNNQTISTQVEETIALPEEEKVVTNESYHSDYYIASLRTPEKLAAAITKFRKNGEYEMADKAIDKLIRFFPDYPIPD